MINVGVPQIDNFEFGHFLSQDDIYIVYDYFNVLHMCLPLWASVSVLMHLHPLEVYIYFIKC